jgi:energy-coupling factor transporter ATP-binding protein EcfA2
MEQTGRLQVDRLVVENFRSIKYCDVSLQSLTFLVGRNGSGKSSFLDALQFVSSAVNKGFAAALADRNGLSTVLYRPGAFPAQIKFKLWFSDSSGRTGFFEIHVRAASWSDCSVIFERCQVSGDNGGGAEYQAEDGSVSGTIKALPPPPRGTALFIRRKWI